ncbi:MAG TPA: hypothetical protein IGS52_15735 [Oscillatoriaceae cyanobacterium M33_DOE_052]|nr:hypothetical protein [Oscillatoriaceae cyanobacterium M33_DOE_052]
MFRWVLIIFTTYSNGPVRTGGLACCAEEEFSQNVLTTGSVAIALDDNDAVTP